jgi:hypothetical protein
MTGDPAIRGGRRGPIRAAAGVILVVGACTAGYAIARADRYDPVVVTREPAVIQTSPRAGGWGSASPSTSSGGQPCLEPAPEAGLTCQDGEWLPPADSPTGGGGPWRGSGCVTPPPANGFRCQDGVWTMDGTSPQQDAASPRPATPEPDPARPADPQPTDPWLPSPSVPASGPACPGPAPVGSGGVSAVCVNGTWVIR